MEKRALIDKITKQQVEKIVLLLEDIKDPRYVDFLLNICTCDGLPVPNIQDYITEILLITNSQHLPQLRLTGNNLYILLLDKKDAESDSDNWIDISYFKKQVERGGKWRDLAGEHLQDNNQVSHLTCLPSPLPAPCKLACNVWIVQTGL